MSCIGESVQIGRGSYARPAAGVVIGSQADLLDLLACSFDERSVGLLFPEGSLAEEFFDLSTGLAGEIALKLSTYRVRTAVVIDLTAVPSQCFQEWAGECNRGSEIRFCASEKDALEWLTT